MGSTFFGIHIASSGLFVAQRALQVVSHNISNANTPGYSRQRLDTHAEIPQILPGIQGTLGTGVDSEAVIQIREAFYDLKYREETTFKGQWDLKYEGLSQVEQIFNEPSDVGINKTVNEFFSALQALSKNPENLTTRALVREKSIAFTENVKSMYNRLDALQGEIDFQVNTDVSLINSYAVQIRDLNKNIFLTELNGGKSNDLRDQRNLVLDKLSQLVKIQTFEDYQKHFTVMINGKPLVSHYNYDQIEVTPRRDPKNPDDVSGLIDLKWKSGAKFRTSAGELRALLDFRDDIDGNSKGIPYYKDRLNLFVDRVSSEINKIHVDGYDLDGNQGLMFFTQRGMSSKEYDDFLLDRGLDGGAPIDVTAEVINGVDPQNTDFENNKIISKNIKDIISNNPDYSNKSIKYLSDGRYYIVDRVKANEITLARDLDLDANKFAAAKNKDDISDGSNINEMINLKFNENLFAWGSADDYVNSLIANLGVDSSEAKRMSANEEKMIVGIENKRQSIMGVSLDEEATMMIKFQHTYNANARMLTTMDEILDRIINRLGRVGL